MTQSCRNWEEELGGGIAGRNWEEFEEGIGRRNWKKNGGGGIGSNWDEELRKELGRVG